MSLVGPLAQFTRIRAVVVAGPLTTQLKPLVLGIGPLICDQEVPPLRLRSILTSAAGPRLEVHLICCVEPRPQLTAVFGAVTDDPGDSRNDAEVGVRGVRALRAGTGPADHMRHGRFHAEGLCSYRSLRLAVPVPPGTGSSA